LIFRIFFSEKREQSVLFEDQSFKRGVDFQSLVLGLMGDDVSVPIEHGIKALGFMEREKIPDRKVPVEYSQKIQS
jgi:hypothetical protein